MPPVEWVGEKASKLHTLNRFLQKTSFHALLTFICFCYLFILWPLSPAASSVSWYWSWLVCSWNIQWRWSLYVRILCGLLSCDSCRICNILTIAQSKFPMCFIHCSALLSTAEKTLYKFDITLHYKYILDTQFNVDIGHT